MVGMRNLEDVDAFTADLEGLGYTHHFTGDEWSHFSKVVLPQLEAYNLHIHPLGSARWERQLLFRDFLRAHADVADAYAALKRDLAGRKLPLRVYAEAKTAVVEDVLARARRDNTDRYERRSLDNAYHFTGHERCVAPPSSRNPA